MLEKGLLISFLILVLQACGGSGNSSIAPVPPSTGGASNNTGVTAKIIEESINIFDFSSRYYSDDFWVNQTASIAVTASNSTI